MKGDADQRERLANEIAALLGPLTRRLRRAFVECAAEHDLPPGDAQALWVLSQRDRLATRKLAEALEIDPANASALVSRLEQRGLLARSTASDDRRKRLVSLTAAGREAKRRLADCVGERRPTFSALSTEDMATLRDLIRQTSR
jgi:DNA-binding MarR family transcriptional regulator